jgi:hypothetical protein
MRRLAEIKKKQSILLCLNGRATRRYNSLLPSEFRQTHRTRYLIGVNAKAGRERTWDQGKKIRTRDGPGGRRFRVKKAKKALAGCTFPSYADLRSTRWLGIQRLHIQRLRT